MNNLAPRWIRARRLMTGVLMAALAHGVTAHAQEYPAKPVRLVVAFTAGGTTDMLARSVSGSLTSKEMPPNTVRVGINAPSSISGASA